MTALLTAKGVASGYLGHSIVTGLDLDVQPGEVVALLGPNGAGKTTTLLTLAGEVKLLAGEVCFDGAATAAPLFRRANRGLAFVPEGRSLFGRLSVAENLRVGRCDARHAVRLFPELESLLKRQAAKLSGGEQQMVTLARALARRPKLLLADELSLGLAPLVVTRLLQAIRTAATEDGLGVLLVEQHVRQALRFSDRVYAMRRGVVAVSGTVAEVEHRLEDAYLSELEKPAGATEGHS